MCTSVPCNVRRAKVENSGPNFKLAPLSSHFGPSFASSAMGRGSVAPAAHVWLDAEAAGAIADFGPCFMRTVRERSRAQTFKYHVSARVCHTPLTRRVL